MTDDLIAELDKELDVRTIDAIASARHMIRGRVQDAFAHSALDSDDATARSRRLDRSADARASLESLVKELTDFVEDLREAQYGRSWYFYKDVIPSEYHSSDDRPADANVAMVRSHAQHGRSVSTEFSSLANDSLAKLQTVLNLPAKVSPRVKRGVLETWRDQTIKGFEKTASALISDSVILSDRFAGRHVVHPDLLEEHPDLAS